jgi:hypothetical protein
MNVADRKYLKAGRAGARQNETVAIDDERHGRFPAPAAAREGDASSTIARKRGHFQAGGSRRARRLHKVAAAR